VNSELQIRTPEGITFSLPLAGPLARCFAWVIDIVLIAIAIIGFGLLSSFLGWIAPEAVQAALILLIFVVQIGYTILMEWMWRGQTVGKRAMRLRVMDVQGLKLQLSQVVMRNLLRAVDFLPVCYLVGGAACVLNRRMQRLGDLAANTVVVSLPRVMQPDIDQLTAGRYNSLREYPHLAARLRQKTSPTEAALVLNAMMRRDQLEPGARVELFAEIADHFRALVEFPPEAVESVGDEQYLRNVVDLLYNPRGAKAEVKPALSNRSGAKSL
jgi:uncharacterized RDD family membrane protein YckC